MVFNDVHPEKASGCMYFTPLPSVISVNSLDSRKPKSIVVILSGIVKECSDLAGAYLIRRFPFLLYRFPSIPYNVIPR